MHQFTRFSWFAGTAILGWAGLVAAQPDAVSQLRQALKMPTQSLESRSQAIQQASAGLGGLGDMRRGLALQEWRDEDVDPQISVSDRQQRGDLQHRFEEAVRDVLAHADATSQAAVADMLADLGVTVRATGSRDSLARVFEADLARLTSQAAPTVREAAAHALGLVHPDVTVAVPALANLLKEKDDEAQRQAAVGALAALMRVSGQLAVHGKAATGVCGSRTDVVGVAQAVLPVAGTALSDAAPVVRRRAVETIGWAATGAGSILLEGHVSDVPDAVPGGRPADKDDWLPLCTALKELAPKLAHALTDKDVQVRALTRRSLQLIADLRQRVQTEPGAAAGEPALRAVLTAAVPQLAEAIADPDWQARQASINVLEMLGPDAAPAAPALARALGDPDRFVRWAAARALGRLAPETASTAVPGLANLLNDSDTDLGIAAAGALEQYGSAALPAASALAQTVRAGHAAELRLAAIHALERIGTSAATPAVPALVVTLSDPEARLRKAAAVALGQYGPAAKEAVEALRQARGDGNAEVQQAAADALLRILTEK